MNIERSLGLLKRATWYETIYISIIILPFPLFAWKEIIAWLEITVEQKSYCLFALISIQTIGIVLFVFGATKYRRKLNTLTMILGYLQDKNYKKISFERVREKYGEQYTDKYLHSLIQTFPDQIRYAVLSDKKHGVARLDQPLEVKDEIEPVIE